MHFYLSKGPFVPQALSNDTALTGMLYAFLSF